MSDRYLNEKSEKKLCTCFVHYLYIGIYSGTLYDVLELGELRKQIVIYSINRILY